MTSGFISEIFSSIQGEGLYVGERQCFLRLAGCNIQCAYCDTPTQELTATGKKEKTPGQRDFIQFNNPVTPAELVNYISSFLSNKELHHSFVITGGEPLLQVGFLLELLPAFKKLGLKIFLETNGTLPENLSEVIELIDIVSLDFKIASATGQLSNYESQTLKSLEFSLLKEVFVKIVFTRESKITEIDTAAKAIASIDREIPLILQPVTPYGKIKHRPTPSDCLSFQAVAKRHLKEVRVIPQIHKILGLL